MVSPSAFVQHPGSLGREPLQKLARMGLPQSTPFLKLPSHICYFTCRLTQRFTQKQILVPFQWAYTELQALFLNNGNLEI